MNKYLAAIYRNDSHSFDSYIQRATAFDRHEINDALRSIINNTALEKTQRIQYAQALLLAGANPDGLDSDGDPYILKACGDQDVELAHLLVNFQCDVNARNDEGTTALHVAASVGNAELAGLLVNSGAHVTTVNSEGETALMLGLRSRPSEELFSVLLIFANIHRRNNRNQSALHIAANLNLVKETEVLIKNGAQVNCTSEAGLTPLHFACMTKSKPEMIKLLLDAKCDPNVAAVDSGDMAVHMLAMQSEATESLQILLDHPDVELQAQAWEQTPLFRAAKSRSWENVKTLLKAGADPDTVINRSCYEMPATVMVLARQIKDARLACALLIAGARKGCTSTAMESFLAPVNWRRFDLQINNPFTLKQACRFTVRRALGRRPDKKVYAMNCLPQALQDYIAMTELDTIEYST